MDASQSGVSAHLAGLSDGRLSNGGNSNSSCQAQTVTGRKLRQAVKRGSLQIPWNSTAPVILRWRRAGDMALTDGRWRLWRTSGIFHQLAFEER